MEAAGVHLIVQRWNPTIAWLITAASLYGAVLLAAIARSIVLRPVLVTKPNSSYASASCARPGSELSNINEIRRADGLLPRVNSRAARTPAMDPDAQPCNGRRPLRNRRETTEIAVALDGAPDLEKVLLL